MPLSTLSDDASVGEIDYTEREITCLQDTKILRTNFPALLQNKGRKGGKPRSRSAQNPQQMFVSTSQLEQIRFGYDGNSYTVTRCGPDRLRYTGDKLLVILTAISTTIMPTTTSRRATSHPPHTLVPPHYKP